MLKCQEECRVLEMTACLVAALRACLCQGRGSCVHLEFWFHCGTHHVLADDRKSELCAHKSVGLIPPLDTLLQGPQLENILAQIF